MISLMFQSYFFGVFLSLLVGISIFASTGLSGLLFGIQLLGRKRNVLKNKHS
jgi:hypothetical protein